jgi:hypothetical protein
MLLYKSQLEAEDKGMLVKLSTISQPRKIPKEVSRRTEELRILSKSVDQCLGESVDQIIWISDESIHRPSELSEFSGSLRLDILVLLSVVWKSTIAQDIMTPCRRGPINRVKLGGLGAMVLE